MTFQKKQMEKEAEEQKQKLLRSEQSLQASQNKEQDLRKKMEVKIQSRTTAEKQECLIVIDTDDLSLCHYFCITK